MCVAMALRMGESCLSESPCLTGESAEVGDAEAGAGGVVVDGARVRGGRGGGGAVVAGEAAGRRRSGAGSGGLDVGTGDAATDAGAGDGGDVDAEVAGQAADGWCHADVGWGRRRVRRRADAAGAGSGAARR